MHVVVHLFDGAGPYISYRSLGFLSGPKVLLDCIFCYLLRSVYKLVSFFVLVELMFDPFGFVLGLHGLEFIYGEVMTRMDLIHKILMLLLFYFLSEILFQCRQVITSQFDGKLLAPAFEFVGDVFKLEVLIGLFGGLVPLLAFLSDHTLFGDKVE